LKKKETQLFSGGFGKMLAASTVWAERRLKCNPGGKMGKSLTV